MFLTMAKPHRKVFLWSVFLFIVATLCASPLLAQNTICASVKIEIAQELTLERQAFEATLQIENTLEDKAITDIDVVLDFKDEKGNSVLISSDASNSAAKFFIRVNGLDGINEVSGKGVLNATKKAIITWLIIPAPGASDGIVSGKLYFVGATFKYKLAGVADEIEVAPDSIYVKPLPLLTLDYFLPQFVFADNPLTKQIEPIEPFSLGVRVQNNGQGLAGKVKIESAQPKIVENEQGLLIDFRLLDSFVQDKPVNKSLLIDFGDIPAGESKMGRWGMQTSLSGKFSGFSAEYSHADSLGGQLTSLLKKVNTHTLLRDVLVDLPKRDEVKDFLAYESFDPLSDTVTGLKVYESNSTTSDVIDQSSIATLNNQQQVVMPANSGFTYAQFDDPYIGTKSLGRVIRSDGKVLSKDNAWLSKKYNKNSKKNSYHLNIFDAATTGKYHVSFIEKNRISRPPVLEFIPLQTTHVGGSVRIEIKASDPDGTIPTIRVMKGSRIFGRLQGSGNGIKIFNWYPTRGQTGRHVFKITASDGVLSTERNVVVVVNSRKDKDGDGMLDSWESSHFGNLDKDGSADTDGDGISDLEEHNEDTDPHTVDGPLPPKILSPMLESRVSTAKPELLIENSGHPSASAIVYVFEIFSDKNHKKLVSAYYAQPEHVSGKTAWSPPENLQEDTDYFWRVRAYNSFVYSSWAYGSFRVNTENSLPNAPTLSYPAQKQEVFLDQLKLVVNASADADDDELFYKFYLYDDIETKTVLFSTTKKNTGNSEKIEWQIDETLSQNRHYYWRVEVIDVSGQPISTAAFTFFLGISDIPPKSPEVVSPQKRSRIENVSPQLVVKKIVGDDAINTLSYFFEIDKSSSFDSSAGFSSGWLVNNENGANFSWSVPKTLQEDNEYFWRVKVRDEKNIESGWVESNFIVSSKNQVPSIPVVKNPGNNAQVGTLSPKLEAFPAYDVDGDQIYYEFEVYQDVEMRNLVKRSGRVRDPRVSFMRFDNDKWYFWRVRAVDQNYKFSEWSALSRFFVNENDYDDKPEFTWLQPEGGVNVTKGESVYLRWRDDDPDSSAMISIYYADNPLGLDSKLLAKNISEDEDGESDRVKWSTSGLPIGNYYFFATIEDNSNKVRVPSKLTFIVAVKKFAVIPLQAKSITGDGLGLNILIGRRSREDQLARRRWWEHQTYGESTLNFDFGSILCLSSLKILPGYMRRLYYEYSFEVSEDGTNWSKIVDHGQIGKHYRFYHSTSFSKISAQYLRVIIHHAYISDGWAVSPIAEKGGLVEKWKSTDYRRLRGVYFQGGRICGE